MNLKMVAYILGKLLKIEAVVLIIPMCVGLIYQEKSIAAFMVSSAALVICSLIIGRKKPGNTEIYAKEGFVIVALAWILWSAFGAMPYYISGAIPSYVDCFFETVSGFTTTGSTILKDIESLPKGMLFWRSLTHWIGGMGVLVLVMAIMPLADKKSMHLLRAEVPGPTVGKLQPRIRSSAGILYKIYVILTILQVIFLMFGGMNLYDALIHAFSTAGTGGFSNRNISVAYYDSAYIDGVITVFLILFGMNFNIFYFLFIKKFLGVLKNEELIGYLGIIGASTAAITVNILGIYKSPLTAFRYAVFQVASVITTAGFYTADYNLWPEFSKTILLLIMVVGACAGSTGGGMKVSRILIVVKEIKRGVKQMIHPKSVSVVKMDGKVVDQGTISGVFLYIAAYVMVLFLSTLLISLNNFDFATSFTGVLTTMNNVGPGISLVGPVENFSMFSNFSKLVFSADMLLGRLDIFPLLMLFTPSVWRKKF